MKTTVVPAQITTVEDKIAGSLSMSQLLLLAAPVFIGVAIYGAFPPIGRFELYKIVLIMFIMAVSSVMAIRLRGRILLLWVILIVRYNLRPRYYVYDKNDAHLRVRFEHLVQDDDQELTAEIPARNLGGTLLPISPAETMKLEQLLQNVTTDVSFRPGKKGGIDVRIAEVER